MNLDRPPAPNPYQLLPAVPSFDLQSSDVRTGEQFASTFVNDGMGQSGDCLSPALRWSGFPAETRSFAVTMFDPDAPTASGFWHWVVVDIPASVTELARGSGALGGQRLPAGAIQLGNDTGQARYDGPAPPAGDRAHHYYIAVHAVDVETLGVSPDARCAIAGFTLTFHVLARAVIVPVYKP
jgi:Raf kinase inhibitor-like YbhB/YbcL family protein